MSNFPKKAQNNVCYTMLFTNNVVYVVQFNSYEVLFSISD